MRLRLEVNNVDSRGYEKAGVHYETLDLVCIDKSPGLRLKHAVTCAPDKSQREALRGVDLRDKIIEFDCTEIQPAKFGGGIVLWGSVCDLDKLTGPLKIDKPGK